MSVLTVDYYQLYYGPEDICDETYLIGVIIVKMCDENYI